MNYNLELLAKQVMIQKGLEPEFSKEALQQLQTIHTPASIPKRMEDLRSLPWCSIDNENSLDLDQLTFAKEENGTTTLFIAIADVDALVPANSAIDLHAQINATSVYTPAKLFPMLPEKLSFHLTSFVEEEDRLSLTIKINIDKRGKMEEFSLFPAIVRNPAKLSFEAVGAWLEGKATIPEKIKKVSGLEQSLLCQHKASQLLQARRHSLGALTLFPSEMEAKITQDKKIVLLSPIHNDAHQLIESFMIAANFAITNYLKNSHIPRLCRIVQKPKRWERIVQIAASFDFLLPQEPEGKALEEFLLLRKSKDPSTFQDLSLVIVKLLGRGENVVCEPNNPDQGHFGLALSAYTHSTAPNRRFVDLISLRQCKAHLKATSNPYSFKQLQQLASHCTQQEDAALKVERQMNKAVAALFLSPMIGASFEGIVTGASEKGTWARIFSPPVEGRIIRGFEKLDVGDRVVVQLESVDVPKGYINFATKQKNRF
jgi:VacB/RNase II family 3'-5' exoribonuclease